MKKEVVAQAMRLYQQKFGGNLVDISIMFVNVTESLVEAEVAQQSVQSDDGYCSCGGEGYVMLLSGAKICNLCKRHRR